MSHVQTILSKKKAIPEKKVVPEVQQPIEPIISEKDYIDSIHGAGSYDSAMKPDEATPYLENFYKSTVKAPTPISERGMENARLASGIGEGLQSLGEILGASQGARVANRDFSNSPIAQQSRNEKEVRNTYDQKESAYNNGLLNAKIGDYSQGLQTKAHNRALIQKSIQDYKATKLQNAKDRQALELKLIDLGYKKDAIDLQLKRFDEEKRSNRAKEAIDWKRASADKTDKFNGIVINAHPSDKKAQTDATGNKVIAYQMTKPEIQNLAAQAQRDKQFMSDNSDYVMVDKPGFMGQPTKGITTDEELARMYMQYKYNKENEPKQTATTQQNFNIAPIQNQQTSQTGNVR
jgi:hypothetical protein